MLIINCFIFNGLTDDEKKDVYSIIDKPQIISKGKELYRSGMLGILHLGSATVKRLNDNGDSITIRTITNDELFGAASVFGSWKDGMSSIISNENCTISYIPEKTFIKILKKYPQISINYIKYLSDKIRFLNRKLNAFTAKSTEQRLYEHLLSQSDVNGNINFEFGISELARRLKVGRTSIYRDIKSLESKGLISRIGHNFKIKK